MQYSAEESFGFFGKLFQTRVLQGAITDQEFFESVFEILKPEYFPSEPHETVWKTVVSLYQKHSDIPTLNLLKVELSALKDEKKTEVTALLFDIAKKVNVSEIVQAKEKAFEFCSNKSMEAAILDCVELLNAGKHDAIPKRMEDALKAATKIDTGHEYFQEESIRDRAKKRIRKCAPTGWPALDNSSVMDGGLGAGELGVFMAPAGIGKSHLLVNVGYGAMSAAMDVVHYSLELSEINIGNRYDARITGVGMKDIPDNANMVEGRLKEFNGGRLVIKEFPTKTASSNTIEVHLGRLRAMGFKPGVVIIDYADLMRSRKQYEQKRFELEAIYEDLRALGMKLKLPIWTATQANRDGFSDQIITLDKMGEAISKAQISDFVATFSRNMADREKGTGTLYIAKNRVGYDGMALPVTIDPSKSYIMVNDAPEKELGEALQGAFDSDNPDAGKQIWRNLKGKKT